MSQSNTFSPSDLSASTENLNTELLLLTLDANTLSQQPDIAVSEVPGLPEHQRAARQTADFLLTDVSSDVTGMNSAIIGFANQFLAFSSDLLEEARVIDDATASASNRQACADRFAAGLRALSRVIQRGQPQRDTTASDLDSLGLRLAQNTPALDGDMDLAEKYLAEGTLKQLSAQLAAVQDTLAQDNATLAQGAVKGLVSALKISVGIAMAYESANKGIELAITGIEGAVAVGEEQKAALADVQTQFAAYQDLMARVSGAQVAWAGVQNVSHAVDSMATHQNTAKAALTGVTRSWKDLSHRLEELAQTLSKTVPSNLGLTQQLDEAVSAWSNLKAQMVRWQADGATVAASRRVRLG